MRTTISLEDRLAIQVRREAAIQGLSVSRFIANTLDDALKKRAPVEAAPFRLVTVSGYGPRPEFNIDQPRALEVVEDEARFQRPGSSEAAE